MHTVCKTLNFFIIAAIVALLPLSASAIETKAKEGIVVDMTTGDVLFARDPDKPVHPASMSKLMTVYMVLDRLKQGGLKLTDKFKVSEKAWRKGGSKMFVAVNSMVSVEDLLQGIIVQSGNDACIVIAEGLAGSEEAFAEEMTARAKELGLTNSHFANATGWPDPGQLMSVRDIATLSQRIITDFPEYYKYFKETSFTYNKIHQQNRNPLLYNNFGADGLKTGHTEAAGYGLAASMEQNGRRVVMVLHGLSSIKARSNESMAMMNWAFREFKIYPFFKKGETVSKADVWLGAEDTVPLALDRDLKVTLPRKARRKLKAKVVYNGPIPAPIAKGTPVAKLVISAPGVPNREYPLVAAENVGRLGPIGRLGAAIQHLIWGSS